MSTESKMTNEGVLGPLVVGQIKLASASATKKPGQGVKLSSPALRSQWQIFMRKTLLDSHRELRLMGLSEMRQSVTLMEALKGSPQKNPHAFYLPIAATDAITNVWCRETDEVSKKGKVNPHKLFNGAFATASFVPILLLTSDGRHHATGRERVFLYCMADPRMHAEPRMFLIDILACLHWMDDATMDHWGELLTGKREQWGIESQRLERIRDLLQVHYPTDEELAKIGDMPDPKPRGSKKKVIEINGFGNWS